MNERIRKQVAKKTGTKMAFLKIDLEYSKGSMEKIIEVLDAAVEQLMGSGLLEDKELRLKTWTFHNHVEPKKWTAKCTAEEIDEWLRKSARTKG